MRSSHAHAAPGARTRRVGTTAPPGVGSSSETHSPRSSAARFASAFSAAAALARRFPWRRPPRRSRSSSSPRRRSRSRRRRSRASPPSPSSRRRRRRRAASSSSEAAQPSDELPNSSPRRSRLMRRACCLRRPPPRSAWPPTSSSPSSPGRSLAALPSSSERARAAVEPSATIDAVVVGRRRADRCVSAALSPSPCDRATTRRRRRAVHAGGRASAGSAPPPRRVGHQRARACPPPRRRTRRPPPPPCRDACPAASAGLALLGLLNRRRRAPAACFHLLGVGRTLDQGLRLPRHASSSGESDVEHVMIPCGCISVVVSARVASQRVRAPAALVWSCARRRRHVPAECLLIRDAIGPLRERPAEYCRRALPRSRAHRAPRTRRGARCARPQPRRLS